MNESPRKNINNLSSSSSYFVFLRISQESITKKKPKLKNPSIVYCYAFFFYVEHKKYVGKT